MVATLHEREAQDDQRWLTGALAAVIFLCFGLRLVLPDYVISGQMPGDLGDSRFTFAMLEYFYRTLVAVLHGRHGNFLDAPFFYPWTRATNFSDTFWGNVGVYALARSLGCGELVSFRFWVIAGYCLTYIAGYLSFRQLGIRPWGSGAAAFLFSFPLPMAAQATHVQLVYRLWVPPAVVALEHFLARGSIRAGAWCFVFVSLQLITSIYLGLFLCLLLASYGASVLLIRRSSFAKPSVMALRSVGPAQHCITATLFVAGLVVLAIVLIPYREVQLLYGFERPWPLVAALLPRPGSYLLAGASRLWPNFSSQFPYPAVWEQQLFPGLAPIAAVLWFCISRRSRKRYPHAGTMLLTTAILVLLTINVGGHTLYGIIYSIPGFSAVRAVSRVILVLLLPLAALFGMLIDDLTSLRSDRTVGHIIAFLVSASLVAECSLSKQTTSAPRVWQERLAALKAQFPKDLPPSAILAVRTPTIGSDPAAWTFGQIDAVIAAISLGIPTLNGYSGNFPPMWSTMSGCRDIGQNLRAGRHFLEEQGMRAPEIMPEQLVLVGFGTCDLPGIGGDPILRLGHAYHFAEGADGNELAGDGFSAPENWGRWTEGRSSFLFFALPNAPSGPMALSIEANSLSGAEDKRQAVTVVANGHSCGVLIVTASSPFASATCATGVLHRGDNALQLRIGRPTRPVDLGINSDQRYLGLGLKALTISGKS